MSVAKSNGNRNRRQLGAAFDHIIRIGGKPGTATELHLIKTKHLTDNAKPLADVFSKALRFGALGLGHWMFSHNPLRTPQVKFLTAVKRKGDKPLDEYTESE